MNREQRWQRCSERAKLHEPKKKRYSRSQNNRSTSCKTMKKEQAMKRKCVNSKTSREHGWQRRSAQANLRDRAKNS
jgi:hypothetical protein